MKPEATSHIKEPASVNEITHKDVVFLLRYSTASLEELQHHPLCIQITGICPPMLKSSNKSKY